MPVTPTIRVFTESSNVSSQTYRLAVTARLDLRWNGVRQTQTDAIYYHSGKGEQNPFSHVINGNCRSAYMIFFSSSISDMEQSSALESSHLTMRTVPFPSSDARALEGLRT